MCLSSHKEQERPLSVFFVMRASLPYVLMSLLPLLLLIGLPHSSESADAKSPHRHAGMLAPYPPKAPSIELDAEALGRLAKGLPVLKQINEGSAGGRGIVVQEVHAPVAVVMGRILDYGNYPKMVPNVAYCGNYGEHKVSKDEVELLTRFVLSLFGVKLEYFIRHTYWPSINTITWTLDYSRASDFDDSVGYWSVVPRAAKDDEWSRVYYSIDLRVPDWIPAFVINILNSQALTQATAWVKTESEKAYKAQQKATAAKAGAKPNAPEVMAPPREGLWAGFVEAYGDMIDLERLQEKEVKWAQKAEEKRLKKELSKKVKPKDVPPEKPQEPSPARVPAKEDDAAMLLGMIWVSTVFYALARLWSSPEEGDHSKPGKGSHVDEATDYSEEEE